MKKFIQPDLPFPVERSPIVVPIIGDRITEVDNYRLSPNREGLFIREVEYLGTTFWEVQSGAEIEKLVPRACKINLQN